MGLTVSNVRYFQSQPWPFPSQLMLGFFADYVAGEITVEPSEIARAGWYRKGHEPRVRRPSVPSSLLIIFMRPIEPGFCRGVTGKVYGIYSGSRHLLVEAIILVTAIIAVLLAVTAISQRRKGGEDGYIEVRRLNGTPRSTTRSEASPSMQSSASSGQGGEKSPESRGQEGQGAPERQG